MGLSATEQQVLEAATMFGWRTAHFRPLLTKHGWRTPVSGDGAGFPDFVLVKGGRCVFVECKGKTNALEPEQKLWAAAFDAVDLVNPGVTYAIVRPDDVEGFVRSVLAAR